MSSRTRILAHMRRWKALGLAKEYFVEWAGKPVLSVKTAFASAVRRSGLPTAQGNVTPHTLRHTAATWLMQNGAPLWEAAGYLGMSEKTLREVYGHHHPDFMKGAVAAIEKRPTPPPRQSLVVSLVEEKAKRQRASQDVENIGGGRSRSRTRLLTALPC